MEVNMEKPVQGKDKGKKKRKKKKKKKNLKQMMTLLRRRTILKVITNQRIIIHLTIMTVEQ